MNGLPGMRGVKVFTGAAASVLLLACMGPMPALADTIEAALVLAYQNNPQLNAQRAQVRITDETVPQALSGYRPRISVTATAAEQYSDTVSLSTDPTPGNPRRQMVVGPQTESSGEFTSRSVGVTGTQILFNGFQTANRTRFAESQVSSAREALRVI